MKFLKSPRGLFAIIADAAYKAREKARTFRKLKKVSGMEEELELLGKVRDRATTLSGDATYSYRESVTILSAYLASEQRIAGLRSNAFPTLASIRANEHKNPKDIDALTAICSLPDGAFREGSIRVIVATIAEITHSEAVRNAANARLKSTEGFFHKGTKTVN